MLIATRNSRARRQTGLTGYIQEIDVDFIYEMIVERFDDAIDLMTSCSFIYGGAIRDPLAGLPLEGDLDITTTSHDHYIYENFIGSTRWVEIAPKAKFDGKSPSGQKAKETRALAGITRFKNVSEMVVDLAVSGKNSGISLESALYPVRMVDFRCCGVVMNSNGKVFEVVAGAYQDCKDRVLQFNPMCAVADENSLNDRIKMLTDRGWKSLVDIKKAVKISEINRKKLKREEEALRSAMRVEAHSRRQTLTRTSRTRSNNTKSMAYQTKSMAYQKKSGVAYRSALVEIDSSSNHIYIIPGAESWERLRELARDQLLNERVPDNMAKVMMVGAPTKSNGNRLVLAFETGLPRTLLSSAAQALETYLKRYRVRGSVSNSELKRSVKSEWKTLSSEDEDDVASDGEEVEMAASLPDHYTMNYEHKSTAEIFGAPSPSQPVPPPEMKSGYIGTGGGGGRVSGTDSDLIAYTKVEHHVSTPYGTIGTPYDDSSFVPDDSPPDDAPDDIAEAPSEEKNVQAVKPEKELKKQTIANIKAKCTKFAVNLPEAIIAASGIDPSNTTLEELSIRTILKTERFLETQFAQLGPKGSEAPEKAKEAVVKPKMHIKKLDKLRMQEIKNIRHLASLTGIHPTSAAMNRLDVDMDHEGMVMHDFSLENLKKLSDYLKSVYHAKSGIMANKGNYTFRGDYTLKRKTKKIRRSKP